jgi:putative ABC transport system permease protein
MVPNIVRLRHGTSLDEANSEMRMLADRFGALARESSKDTWFQLVPVTRPQFQFHNFHYALIAAVIAVLLVACANLANLQVARGLARSRELAVRTALGAARRDLIAQLLVESSVLGAAGLGAGLVATIWGVHLLRSRIPPAVAEYVVAPQTSWRVFLFALAACLVCILLVGLVPAIRVSRVDANELLKASAGTGSHKHNQRRYGAMIVIELGLTLAVLSGASILLHSALAYDELRPNYDIRSLTTASFGVRFPRGDTVVRYVDLANAVISRVRGVPDVADVAMKNRGAVEHDTVTVELADGGMRVVPVGRAGYSIVSPSYLRTLGLPLVHGRDFQAASNSGGEVIVDAPTAAYLWHGQNPVGGAIKLGSPASSAPWVPVVGVAAATNDQLPTRDNPYPVPPDVPHLANIYYSPSPSDNYGVSRRYEFSWVDLLVRAKTDPARMPIMLRSSLHATANMRAFVTGPAPASAPQFALSGARELEESIGLRTARQAHDFVASIFTAFAALALVLSGIGIYGLVAHSVAERRRELGVRLALGASTRHILEVVLREGNALMLGGVAFGLLLTKYTVAWLWDFIFEEDKWNAPLFAEMGAVIIVVALVAAIVPALRATRIDPVESLRSE